MKKFITVITAIILFTSCASPENVETLTTSATTTAAAFEMSTAAETTEATASTASVKEDHPDSYNDWDNIDRNTTKLTINCVSQYDIDMLAEFDNLVNLSIVFGHSFDEDHAIPAPKTIDLTPVSDKTGLQELYIVSCPKTDDFSWLKNFENLTDLMITGTFENYGVFDMKSISSLKHFENLNLQEHYIKNFEEISKLKSLKSFRFVPIGETDITPIGELSNLTELKFWDYRGFIKDYTAISKLSELTTLGLRSLSDETDFSFLSTLENLTEIEFVRSNITNCKFIESIKNKDKITTLILHYNKIESIENIELLTNLEGVNLSNNRIKSISEISDLKQLTRIILSDNEIEDFSPIFVTNTIETCGLAKRIDIDNNKLNWDEIVDLVSGHNYVQLMG
jgi:Leucine-rich repeat (LRR) protein